MCRCVDKPRHAPGLAGAPAAQEQQAAAKFVSFPDLAGQGWKNPANPAEVLGEGFDFWAPTPASAATTGSPAESTYTTESQAATPLQGEETDEWAEQTKDTFEPPAYYDCFAPEAFFRDLATSLGNDEADLITPSVVQTPAPSSSELRSQNALSATFVHTSASNSGYFQAPSMYLQQAPANVESYVEDFTLPAPHSTSEIRAPVAGPIPTAKKAPAVHHARPVAVKIEAIADGDKLCKWKRRDIAKHLAGERSRRAKRMGKVHTLQGLVEGLPNKPTVNQILAAAIEQIKRVKAEQSEKPAAPSQATAGACPHQAEASEINFRDGFRVSSFTKTMVLDENHCIIEASPAMLQALNWPDTENTIKGQYIASLMHPEDACALVEEALKFRSSGLGQSSVQAVRTLVSFMGFMPMRDMGECGGFVAFPQGYMRQVVVDVTINAKTMFVCVP